MNKPISLATSTWDQREIDALYETIATGNFTMGAEVAAYEREFAAHFGSKYCVMVSSGSAANLLMIASLFYHPDPRKRLSAGDEIIVPAVSWSTTYFPCMQYGLTLKFVDIDIDTLNFDLECLREAITENTRAIFAVNLLGNPNEFNQIRSLMSGRDILLLEDNCESMGASFDGKQCGTFGLAGTFSSFFSHHICTMEGGYVLTNDEELYHVMLSMRAHGWTRNLPEKNHVIARSEQDPFYDAFQFVLPGYNLRPLELSAAVGREQLRKLDSFVSIRRENFDRFLEIVSPISKNIILQQEIGESSVFGFSMVLTGDLSPRRGELVEALRRNQIECRPIVSGNFLRQPVAALTGLSDGVALPNADCIHDSGLFIGNHHVDISEELIGLGKILENFVISA